MQPFKPMKKIISIALVLANFIGIFFYLRNASLSWAIPEEASLSPGIAGPSFVWVLGALPLILVFILIDVTWFYVIKSRKTDRLYVYISAATWIFAIAFDVTHH
jgi:hypothetical protein